MWFRRTIGRNEKYLKKVPVPCHNKECNGKIVAYTDDPTSKHPPWICDTCLQRGAPSERGGMGTTYGNGKRIGGGGSDIISLNFDVEESVTVKSTATKRGMSSWYGRV